MDFITYNEFKEMPEYQSFIKENDQIGYLKVMAFTAYQAMPIENVEILVTKEIGDKKVLFFRGKTDSSGIIDNIELPAPKSGYDLKDFAVSSYAIYEITAIKQDFETIKNYFIGMFGGLKIIQYIKMIPNQEENTNDN